MISPPNQLDNMSMFNSFSRNPVKHGVIVLLVVLLSACEIKTRTDIFLGDLFDVINTGDVIDTESKLSVQIASKDECNSNSAKLLPMLQGTFGESVHAEGCLEEGMNTFAVFGMKIPILIEDAMAHRSDTLALALFQEEEWYGLRMTINVGRMKNLSKLISDEFFQTVDFSTADVAITIANDLREKVSIAIRGAFVDGKPVQEYTDFTLKRRDELDVQLSDVAGASAFTNGVAGLFYFRLSD